MSVTVTQVTGHVAQVEIDRPPHNHVSVELMTELADALLDLDEDKDVWAVVLCSAGKNFCAGADLAGGKLNPDQPPIAATRCTPRPYACSRPRSRWSRRCRGRRSARGWVWRWWLISVSPRRTPGSQPTSSRSAFIPASA